MNWIKELRKVNRKPNKYSQYGEECYLRHIFDNVGTTNKYFVDLGANDGLWLSNTRLFKEKGWDGLLVDGKQFEGVVQSFITKENILKTLKDNNVPKEFDLLSIDIDGNDYWILDKVLTKYSPRVIISEYNSEHTDCKTIKYDPKFEFRANDYYGYTFKAGLKLAEKHGYIIIHQSSNLNLYYLRKDLLPLGTEIHVESDYFKWWGNPTDKEWHIIK